MKPENMVDLILDGKYNKVKKAEKITDRLLEFEDVETTTGTDVGDSSGQLSPVDDLKDKRKEDIAEKINTALKEADELTADDFKDYFDDLKKKGLTDEDKLKGMLSRAKEIAKKQGKENDKQAVMGIMQGFMGGK